MATLSIIISFGALAISTLSLAAIRKHQKLSVTPHIDIDRVFLPPVDQVGIRVRNNGIGPAVVESCSIYIDNKKINSNKEFQDFLSKCNAYEKVINMWYRKGEIISVGSEEWIVKADAESFIDENDHIIIDRREDMDNYLSKIKIEIKYSSLYKEKYPPSTFDYSII